MSKKSARWKGVGSGFLRYIGGGVLIFGIVIIALAAIFKTELQSWLGGLVISSNREYVVSSLPVGPAIEAFQANFTELFSGVGWKNEKASTAHQDTQTTAISFPPAYAAQEVPSIMAVLGGEKVLAARGSGKVVVVVTRGGNIVAFGPSGQAARIPFSSKGESLTLSGAAIDYDAARGVWAAVGETSQGIAASSFSFTVGSDAALTASAGLFNRVGEAFFSDSSPADTFHPLGVACVEGRCVVSARSKLLSFSATAPSDVSAVTFPAIVSYPTSLSVGKTESRLLLGLVSKKDAAYEGYIYEIGSSDLAVSARHNVFSSNYPGVVCMGLDAAKKKLLAVYAAYVGGAKEFSVKGDGSINDAAAADLSRFLGQRVLGGAAAGEVAVVPEIASSGGAWWLYSGSRGVVSRLLRIDGGLLSDVTDGVVDGGGGVVVSAGFAAQEAFAFFSQGGAEKVLLVRDKGFDLSSRVVVWESSRINFWDGRVVRGAFERAESGGGTARYFLSNDGGISWQATSRGVPVVFKGSGGDFRFRVELVAPRDAFASPWVDTIGVEYFVARGEG